MSGYDGGKGDIVRAAANGNLDVVKRMLSKFPDEIDSRLEGRTALQEASRKGHLEIIKELCRQQADLNCGDRQDNTPLHYAVMGNQPEAVGLLISMGADMKEDNICSQTPPQLAFEKNYNDCLKKFLEIDPTVSVKTKQHRQRVASSEITLPNEENKPGIDLKEDALPKVPLCVFCKERPVMVNFEPCGHKVSCFWCSFKNDVCKDCGNRVEKISFTKNKEIDNFMEETKKMSDKIQELSDSTICHICNENPINCNMRCGHVFCIDCVNRNKIRGKDNFTGPFQCHDCRETSKYYKLYPPWNTDKKS